MNRSIRVLHLEDNPRDAELVQQKLKTDGLTCEIAWVDGREAFESVLVAQAFDVVLCDYNVPGYDGITAMKRAREKQPETPVILLSGSLGEEEAVETLKAGATDYVLKDRLQRLVPAINRALSEAGEQRRRRQAEKDLRALNADLERRVAERTRQLEEASRAKSDFLANMSHELRTPLNAIIGFSEMLKDGVLGELDAKQRGFVVDVFNAGTHLLSLINDILDLSKVEAGMLQLEPGAIDVAALLKASMLVVREKAAAHRIRLDTGIDPALGTMLADERKLKQIVYNLLSNAVKFTPEGGAVTLRARRCARAEVGLNEALPGRLLALPPGEGGEFLMITVEDTGVGIAEEHLPKLFEPFTQVDSSVARREGGTGLGLSIVRRLAELHGGTVGVVSRPGAGSRFCVWVPWCEAVLSVPKQSKD